MLGKIRIYRLPLYKEWHVRCHPCADTQTHGYLGGWQCNHFRFVCPKSWAEAAELAANHYREVHTHAETPDHPRIALPDWLLRLGER